MIKTVVTQIALAVQAVTDKILSTSESVTNKVCPDAPDPYTTGELHMAVKVAKDNLHVIQANNVLDHSLTHRGINNIGVMLDKQNARADTFFDKLQTDHIEVFDKLQEDHGKVFKKLQSDHSEVFDKLQQDNADVFKKLQEDHSLMLGKFQKDHLQLIMQTYDYQIRNEKDLYSIKVEQQSMTAKLDAIMEKLLSVEEIAAEKKSFEDFEATQPTASPEAEPALLTDPPLPVEAANSTPKLFTDVVEDRPFVERSATPAPTASVLPSFAPSYSPSQAPSSTPSVSPPDPIDSPFLLRELVKAHILQDWKDSVDAAKYG